ncbi:MAG: TraR/DksA family transcriptional regulator [Candidatus Omnitrophota bacterium]
MKKKPQITKTVKSRFTAKDLSLFKKSLVDLKAELADQLQHIYDNTLKKSQKDASGDISGYTLHMADVATDNYDREFSLGLASYDRQVLLEIEDALKKIEEKTFGLCELCHKPITKTRLKAIPYVRNCLKCQQDREKK